MKSFQSNPNKISLVFAALISLLILGSHFSLPFYKDYFFTKEISWDIFSYYLYLPMTFIHNDPGITDFSVIENIMSTYQNTNTFYQAFKIDNGNFVLNYMCGFAILFSPFFFIGHVWALIGGYPIDGFSFPYQFSVSTGVYVYIIAGIFGVRKLLLKFFSDKITTLTMIFLLAGTNYFNEAVRSHLMPHAMMFALVIYFILLTLKWHNKPTVKISLLYGGLFALMVLSRPSELLLIIFPLLLNVRDKESLIKKFQFYLTNIKYILIAAFGGFIMCVPQLLYWKYVTGNFVFFSYQNTEGFNFFEPHLIESLFSFKNSWIIYTPIIIFPLFGLFTLYRKNRNLFTGISIFIVMNFYILSCWLAWWNGGGFGMRYFVESYALLSIPFGYLIQTLLEKKWFVKIPLFSMMILFVVLNLFQTWQAANYIMPHDQRNFSFYKANFFATSIKPENSRLLDVERSYSTVEVMKNEDDYTSKSIGYFNFEDVNTASYNETYRDSTVSFSAPYSFRLDASNPYSPGVNLPFGHVTKKDHFWVRVNVKYFPVADFKENPAAVIFTMEYNGRNFYYRAFELSDYPYELNKWNTLSVQYLTPYPFSYKNENIVAYVWLKGNKPLYIDNLDIKAMERKW